MADITLSNYWDNQQLAVVANAPMSEYATLVVGGVHYNQWKTVRVKMEVGQAWQEFQFSVAEPIDVHSDFGDWRIQVGDQCQIMLGGVTVIDGTVEVREGAYDANNHGVMFFGRSIGSHAADGSVHMREGNQTITGTFTDIVSKALQGTCVSLLAPGDDGTVFPNFSINFGETPWHVAERLARFIPGLRVTDTGFGTWVAQRAENVESGGAIFVEGQNILEARATIDITRRFSFFDVRGQRANQQDESPSSTNEVEGYCSDPTVEGCRWMCISAEEPSTEKMAFGRAQHELAYNAQEIVHADVKVYGWFASPGTLFNIRKQYGIYSPMLNLNRTLWSRVVTFEQNEGGTFTTIELCTPESLTGLLDVECAVWSGDQRCVARGVFRPGQNANSDATERSVYATGPGVTDARAGAHGRAAEHDYNHEQYRIVMRASGRSTGNRAMSMLMRGLHNVVDDSKLMQQGGISGLASEGMKQIERLQNYAMSSIPLPPNSGGGAGSDPGSSDGWGAEHIMSFMGGNRSHGLMMGVDDRRNRPRDMKPGESYQYDDQGMGTLIRRGATYMMGGGYGQGAAQRFASMRHVMKTKPGFPGQGGGGGASVPGTAEVLTPSGFRPIESLQMGDEVISYNEGQCENEPDTVIGRHQMLVSKPLFEIKYEGGSVRCTHDHMVWVNSRRSYVAADKLFFSDQVLVDGQSAAIISVKPLPAAEQVVFDITTKKHSNFYARDGGEGAPMLVHNQNGSGGGSGGSGDYQHEGASATSELQTQNGNLIGTAKTIVKHYIGDFAHQVAEDHVSFTKGKTAVWIDKDGNIYSTKPIQQKPYPYEDKGQTMSGSSGSSGSSGGGGS